MGLDILKLENVKKEGSKTIARCPACAEEGMDNNGNHLVIYPDDRFACVVNQDDEGHKHRQRIFELVGDDEPIPNGFKINTAPVYEREVIKEDILGRLGHLNLTYARKKKEWSLI
jgi:hypothetical protein